MNKTVKNILFNTLGVVLGVFIGSYVNMSIINLSGSIIPPPKGADLTTMEGLKESMSLFEFRHFIMPFLAHALGTLIGTFLVALVAKTYRLTFALVIGGLFFVGGLMMALQLPSPWLFNIVDLGFAYIPMALLGWKIASVIKK